MLVLAEKSPEHFRTQAIEVEFDAKQLSYQPIGAALTFAQMSALRQPLKLECSTQQPLQLANLGVSVTLSLTLAGQDYWLLVRQTRHDRGDEVLKLISGYVPLEQLQNPLLCALDEVREECLIQSAHGWLMPSFADQSLAPAYPEQLQPQAAQAYKLSLTNQASKLVLQRQQPLAGQPNAYVHLPTRSLQLIYDLHLQLPELEGISLFHADECFEAGRLITRLHPNQTDLYLLPISAGKPADSLWQLQQGQLQQVATEGIWLSEYFCPRQGWLIEQSRISWADWQAGLP